MKSANSPALLPQSMLYPFILVTSLFALWGFANDLTNPLVKAFKDIFVISNAQSSLVQTAFYGGYATMALPAAIFIFRFSYKAGILMGLGLYATGAFIAIPAAMFSNFNIFLIALYVLTFGLAFLETTANPYILSMGPKETGTRRLNLAQAFNPIGSLSGMVVASLFILSSLQVEEIRSEVNAYPENRVSIEETDPALAEYLENNPGASFDQVMMNYKEGTLTTHSARSFAEMQQHDLDIVKTPYVAAGLVVVAIMLVFAFSKMPDTNSHIGEKLNLSKAFGHILKNKVYLGGVIAQTAYVAAQIMCWTFIIHYATANLGMSAASAQNYNILAMAIFCGSRFICTFLLKYLTPAKLLLSLAICAMGTTLGVIFLQGYAGLYCLIATSACMSLMFPTIYGIALEGMEDEAKLASAGLIFAIVGGALAPPLQGHIIDMGDVDGLLWGIPSVSVSFVLPFVCFLFISVYALFVHKMHRLNSP